jgi:glutathione S-transferase
MIDEPDPESRRSAVVLFRCGAPTDRICPCGKVARRLKRNGVDFEVRRMPMSRARRPEIVELTGQERVPVLINGDEVIHDSRRILEYVEREWGSR